MASLSQIKLPNGTTYDLKDNGALQLTGGQVTGPVTFGDSVSIDEATLGDLVVNGSASFTNNIQVSTINGVTVGSSPKFTDTNTEVSTLTLVAGSTAGTSLTSGGKFTLTAGSKTVSFTMPTIPSVPSNIVNTITTTAGTHTAITSQKGNVSFNVPTKTSHLTNDSGFITSYTDEKLKIEAVSNNTYYPIVGANSTAASIRQYDSTGFSYSVVNGTTSSTGCSTLILGNNITQGNANNKEGRIKLYSSKNGYAELYMKNTSTSQRLICFPDKGGTVALTSDIPTVPSSTGSATTGISIAAHGTGTVIGVQSTTTTASKVTVGSSSTDYGVKSVGSASNWVFEDVACDDITAWNAGSGSGSLTFTMDTTDTKKLKIAFSHSHTVPSLSYSAKTASHVKSGGNGTAPTLGSKVPTVSASDVTVPIKNASASTFVTGTTHTVTDNGHTHTI